jgi:hypothetical protein
VTRHYDGREWTGGTQVCTAVVLQHQVTATVERHISFPDHKSQISWQENVSDHLSDHNGNGSDHARQWCGLPRIARGR